jgi:hypothetical protein
VFLRNDLIKYFHAYVFKVFCHQRNIRVFSIVEKTVFPDKIKVSKEILGSLILVFSEVVKEGLDVHWGLDYDWIVRKT